MSAVKAAAIPAFFVVALAAMAPLFAPTPPLFRALLGAAGALAVWGLVVFAGAARAGRRLEVLPILQKNHWVQLLAQGTVLVYWGWHIDGVYAFFPLILAQILFAFGVDILLQWSRRDTYRMTLGPIPVMFSINLFLWFKPEWFHWQFVMIALGFLAKELIRWTRDGRTTHIFNPSSFPLAVFSLVLIVTGTSDTTLGQFIANTQHDAPHIYLVIFLASLPGQLLFGVARMTLSAVVTAWAISQVYFAATGTYLFFDTHIPVPVFLGMHLLFTDPSTSPRSELGRVLFGMIYAVGTAALFVLLPQVGAPTFYDKLLPVPIMNLMVRFIDGVATSSALARLDPARVAAGLSPARRHVAWAGLWVVAFTGLSLTQGVGDRHPGQYLPFWEEACADGSARACAYREYMTLVYCNNGSGWACNEWGILQAEAGRSPGQAFGRACERGFQPGCANAGADPRRADALVRERPPDGELPIVLRGTKPVLEERDAARLRALACEQGWAWACGEARGA